MTTLVPVRRLRRLRLVLSLNLAKKEMICIFCKQDSSSSKSIEHIIPESLGNRKYFLKRGVVCDICNNYFAIKIEKPFLENDTMVFLRSKEEIPSKKGKIPPLTGIMLPGFPVQIQPFIAGHKVLSLEKDAYKYLTQRQHVNIAIKAEHSPPEGAILSRMLAKMALEAMAYRLMDHPDGLEYLAKEKQLDLIRYHARRGDNITWPVNKRKIYDVDAAWIDENGSKVQVLHEHDILHTDNGEFYFAVIIFGMEFVINYGGPEIIGYLDWLEKNDNASPLYFDKNANVGIKPWKSLQDKI